MKQDKEKKAYIEPQILTFSLAGDCPILAGSPPVNTTPEVIPPVEDNTDTELVGE
ncbi:hypothetical protein [Prevotella melaninogenica]|jgi:conserved domain protein|uniref:hypothetical protein n=1 Tax=Prevotella melaninogenica TaxID=28132 RepID=UPI0001AEB6DF|nr:hypothetical protein [Prevotella melaninogenica]ADK95895.1 hypothetical protein HMPREF0659_A5121 [Prevotella melaninogenica ATCC 25845]UEB07722.1 hypothetical protein LK441_06370 [Prevotella melaninogenica]